MPRPRAKLKSLEMAILEAEEEDVKDSEDVKDLEERFQRRKHEWNGERREVSETDLEIRTEVVEKEAWTTVERLQ